MPTKHAKKKPGKTQPAASRAEAWNRVGEALGTAAGKEFVRLPAKARRGIQKAVQVAIDYMDRFNRENP